MFIECFTNNGKPYLRLARSVRVTNKNGLKVSQKQPVLNLGPLERFDDGQPDFLDRLKKSFKAGKRCLKRMIHIKNDLTQREFGTKRPDDLPDTTSTILLESVNERDQGYRIYMQYGTRKVGQHRK